MNDEIRLPSIIADKAGDATAHYVTLVAADVREFFGVTRAEIEPDGSIFVEGPVEGHYLCKWEVHSCLRHLSARRGVAMCHVLPPQKLTGRPPTSSRN